MTKRKKRNAITMVSLLLALVALIVIYIWYDNRPTKDEVEEIAPTIDLATLDTEQISSLHYVREDADITLVLQDEVWISKEEPERPINQERITTILNAINDIKADRVIMEKPENLADYGLADPVAYLQAVQKDGTTVTIRIGNEAGESEGYYGMVNDDGIVYLLPVKLGTALQYNNTQMTAVEESPVITAANIKYIKVEKRDGEDFELEYRKEDKLDNAGSDLYEWKILKPYGEDFSADNSQVSTLQSNYTSFNYISCVDYQGDDLTRYGLDEPMASIDIGYTETRTETLETPEKDPETGEEITEKTYQEDYQYKVYIGNKDDQGNYYIRKEGSDYVYTISSSSIDTMLEVDAFSLLNPFVLIPNIASVDEISFDYKGTSTEMRIERKTEKNEEGEDETLSTYYFNGEVVEESAFKSLYQTLISLQFDAEAVQVELPEDKAVVTLKYHLFGEQETTLEAAFLPYDESFYLVKKGDQASFLVDKRKVDDLIKAVSEFTGKENE